MKALILEGPTSEHMRGWRHFQVVIKLEHGQKVSSFIALNGSGPDYARALRGKFFAAGTWERLCVVCGNSLPVLLPKSSPGECCGIVQREAGQFPAPRPEILDLLVSENQRELPV